MDHKCNPWKNQIDFSDRTRTSSKSHTDGDGLFWPITGMRMFRGSQWKYNYGKLIRWTDFSKEQTFGGFNSLPFSRIRAVGNLSEQSPGKNALATAYYWQRYPYTVVQLQFGRVKKAILLLAYYPLELVFQFHFPWLFCGKKICWYAEIVTYRGSLLSIFWSADYFQSAF